MAGSSGCSLAHQLIGSVTMPAIGIPPSSFNLLSLG